MMGAMYGLASPYYNRLREAVGLQTYARKRQGTQPGPPTQTVKLEPLLRSSRPVLITVVGMMGLLVILWLMVYKPF
jgi:hypothetical protein